VLVLDGQVKYGPVPYQHMGQLEVKYGPFLVLDGPTNGRRLTRQPTLPGFYTGKIVAKTQLLVQK
jgi:hypothetical protein